MTFRQFATCLAFALGWMATWEATHASDRPNVLLILADDLGFSDLGCYGGEIETPVLDRLADGGLRFTQFCNTGRCWPTRASLLTGYFAQQVRRDAMAGVKKGDRPNWARLLPEMLQPLGYRSYHSGKWHIDGRPLKNGFDRSYNLEDMGRYFRPQRHTQDDERLPPVDEATGYYSTIAIADHAIECLREHAAQYSDQPFFQFVAFTAPHFPLQALPADIAKYEGKYDAGWETMRHARWERIQQLDMVKGELSPVERQVGPPYDFPTHLEQLGPGEVNRPLPWGELTEEQRRFQAQKMEIHAAMVDRMDHEIGRIVDQLQSMGAWDDTLILFLSDNGASAEIMVRDDGHDRQAEPGSAATHLCLGPGWSNACNTPFRRHKTWVHFGGIATPFIVHWPAEINDRGQLRRSPGHVVDIVPTVLNVAGGNVAGGRRPSDWKGTPMPPSPGKSLLPLFAGDHREEHHDLWWMHEGNRALRRGDWKIVAAKDEPWELFHLGDDPTESADLATEHPDKLHDLEALWEQRSNEIREVANGAEASDASIHVPVDGR